MKVKIDPYKAIIELSRRHLISFSEKVKPELTLESFHRVYYELLDRFAKGEIKKLIISMPPQHGKSEGSTRLLPSYLFGRNPDLKIAIASYSTPFARKFNRDIQRILTTKEYQEVFPNTRINDSNVVTVNNYLRNADEFEIVNRRGSLKAVGRQGALTGNPVDVLIMDDLYKDIQEAGSPVIRENVWDWYLTVADSRLHNNSQQLIVFTRWHDDDLIGRIEEAEEVMVISSFTQLTDIPEGAWVKINFQAIKEDLQTDIDPREIDEPLWGNRHSFEKLARSRKLNPAHFNSLYQGDPKPKEGLLYDDFGTYGEIKEQILSDSFLADIADKGDDYLCSVWYKKGKSGLKYVYDVLYSNEGAAKTLPIFAKKIETNTQRKGEVESNNSGHGYVRELKSLISPQNRRLIKEFNTIDNKESKIINEAVAVNREFIFPSEWESRWPVFAKHLQGFRSKFSANAHDDIPDVLSTIIQREQINPKKRAPRNINRK